jgi:hypothetical protein
MGIQRPAQLWQPDTLAELQATGSDDGVAEFDVAVITDAGNEGTYRCSAVTATTSTWVSIGGGGPAEDLATTLAAGDTTGSNNIVLTGTTEIINQSLSSYSMRGLDGVTGSPLSIRGGESSAAQGGGLDLVGGPATGSDKGGIVRIESGQSALGDSGDIELISGASAGNAGLVHITNTALQWTELASVPGPTIAASEGRLWVKNDAPNNLVFTDDAGTDHVITQPSAPAAHASTHSSGGSDPITVTDLAGFAGPATQVLARDGSWVSLPAVIDRTITAFDTSGLTNVQLDCDFTPGDELTDHSSNGYDLEWAAGTAGYAELWGKNAAILGQNTRLESVSKAPTNIQITGDLSVTALVWTNGFIAGQNSSTDSSIVTLQGSGESSSDNWLYSLRQDTSGDTSYFVEFGAGTNYEADLEKPFPVGGWHAITLTRNGSTGDLEIYVDGEPFFSFTGTTLPTGGTASWLQIDRCMHHMGHIVIQSEELSAAAVYTLHQSSGVLGGTAGGINHSILSNLSADDHTQYARTDGTRDITGTQTFNASIDMDAASPDLTIGDGTGTSDINLQKSNVGGANINYRTDTGSGISSHWIVQFDANEDLSFLRRNATGAPVDVPLRMFWSNGNISADNNFTADGQIRGGSNTATVSGTTVTLDFDNGNSIEFDAQPSTGNITVTLDNMQDGGIYYAVFLQGSTARTLSFTASGLTIKWSASDPADGGGTQPGAIGFNNRYDIYRFHRVGSNVFAILDWRDELTPG